MSKVTIQIKWSENVSLDEQSLESNCPKNFRSLKELNATMQSALNRRNKLNTMGYDKTAFIIEVITKKNTWRYEGRYDLGDYYTVSIQDHIRGHLKYIMKDFLKNENEKAGREITFWNRAVNLI